MDKNEQLSLMIDAIVAGDDEAIKASFAPYIEAKSREVLGYPSEPAQEELTVENLNKLFGRDIVTEDASKDVANHIRLQGDKVFVDGKMVGVIQSDPADFDSGIDFIAAGGDFSKEFHTVEDLYTFLTDKYTKDGNK